MGGGRVHGAAAAGFAAAADAYEKARPSYPPEAVALLVDRLGVVPGTTVVDLGAGTGKLTRLLVPTGARLVAVEPVAEMRSALAEAVPGCVVVEGTAEAIPLPDSSVDAVAVAQAFHWFDGPAALVEIRRVLRSGGALGLVWNSWDRSVEWVDRLRDLVHAHSGDAPRYDTGAWRQAFPQRGAPGFTPLEEAHLTHVDHTDVDRLQTRIVSTSYIAALPDAQRRQVLDEVAALVADQPDRFPLPLVTDVYWCRPA